MLKIQHHEGIIATTAKMPPLPPLPSMTMKSPNFVQLLPPLEQFTDNDIGGGEPKEPSQEILSDDSDQTSADMDRTRQIR
jgi:hypothetical protein